MPSKAIQFILPFICSFFFLSFSLNFGKFHYLIDDSSYLTIEGTSNITAFECKCKQVFAPGSLTTNVFENGSRVTIQNGKLAIETKSFDCGQKGINKDMHRALEADTHPYITIDLFEILQKKTFVNASQGEWLIIQARAKLTIAECTQIVDLEVKGIELDSGRYQFVCSENLKMSSFNIDPPKPLLGLIKVDDDITIHFNLVIALLDV